MMEHIYKPTNNALYVPKCFQCVKPLVEFLTCVDGVTRVATLHRFVCLGSATGGTLRSHTY